jgi:MFS family permease
MTLTDTRSVAVRALRRFPALRYRNYRRYALGQTASIGGTWLQSVALSWYVLEHHGSGRAVGLVLAAQFVPAMLLGAWAGVVADRYDARTIVRGLQVFLGAQAIALAVAVFTGFTPLWLLVVLALWQGVGTSFDQPIRQGLMNDLVGDAELPTAVAMNSALVQMGLILGPALAALLIHTVGTAWCFVVNACSFALMYMAISSIRPSEMFSRNRPSAGDGTLRAGFAYIRSRRDIQRLLAVMVLSSLVAFRLEVLLPLLAKDLHGGSSLFSVMTMLRGAGALVASLWFASRTVPPRASQLRVATAIMCASLALLTIPNKIVVLIALVPAGIGLLSSMVVTLSLTQVLVSPEFRGRIVALWFVALNGGMVVGSLLTGALADARGPQFTFGVGAVSLAMIVAGLSRWPEPG